ncbi:porin [Pseudohoeflea suaedae]|uniref:Porin n=1 Tax=Pseudohoeflea suaedae TaxID=877384 RepID=A0A4R5PJJ4_9HYPH|nr:porin [Pseudohoeflea suaedae]TDH35839.1 porin [Pseudohoeflea suaedae]
MNIKSLLLGSAAALVAVSGARAADAIIVAEPEPVEYVRVCDAFGTGYFYIPGTETCLRIHGYVRFDVFGGDLFENISSTEDGTYGVNSRLSLRTSTASETELGTLRTYTETRFNYGDSDATSNGFVTDGGVELGEGGYYNDTSVSLNFAWIQLGGLRVGKDESFFITWTGYAGAVINDTPLGGYGPFDTNLISYTYNGGAFRAGIAVEQGDDDYILDGERVGWGIDDYVPHVVVGLGTTFGMVDLSAVAAYDSRDDFDGEEYGGWAAKIRADVAFNDAFSVFAMLMYGENSSGYTTWANGENDEETFAAVGGFSYAFSDKASLNTQFDWVEGNDDQDDEFAVTANVAYELVPGLVVTPEVQYVDFGDDEEFGAGVRVQRSF